MTESIIAKILSGIPRGRCIHTHGKDEVMSIPDDLKSPIADGELLALGRQLEKISGELKTVRMWVDEVSVLFDAEIEKFATWPDDQDEWTRWDGQAHWETRCRIERETEIGMAFARAVNAEQAVYNRIDPLCDQIKSVARRSPAGRALKRWASAIQLGEWPNHPAAVQREQRYRSYQC
jgi:hypothetical protein